MESTCKNKLSNFPFLTGCTNSNFVIPVLYYNGTNYQNYNITFQDFACGVFDNYVSGATLNGYDLTLTRNDGVDITVNLFDTDNFLSGGTYSNGFIYFSGHNTNFSVDVSALLDDTNTYVTGSTLDGSILTLTRNDGVQISTDLTPLLFTGNTSGSCISDLYVHNLGGCSPVTLHTGFNSPNSLSVNNTSFAFGENAVATGNTSFAFGYNTRAEGDYSHAEGFYTTASSNYSHSSGAFTTASGTASHAEGNGTIASGYYSHAEGSKTIASNNTTHAEGQYTTASGIYSHSGGGGKSNGYIIASGISSFNHSTTDGNAGPSYALGNYSAILGGVNNNVYGERSVVLGGIGIIGYSGNTVYVPKIEIVETTNQIIMVDAVTGLRNSIVLSGGTFIITEL